MGALIGHRAFADGGDEGGRAVVAGVLGSAMGGGDKNAQSAKTMVDAIASAGADADKAGASGDSAAEAQAGLTALNAMVRGGNAPVKPIARQALRVLLPDSVSGLSKTSSDASSGAFAGFAGSSATANYGGSSGSIAVELADLGNVGGIAAIASIGANMAAESEDDSGYEKTVTVDGRKVHEKWTNASKRSELLEIVDNRYAISVDGSGVDLDTALAALKSVDVAKFQALGAAR